MPLHIQEFLTQEDQCSYLPNKMSKFHYVLIDECPLDLYESLLFRGFRRFGKAFFRHMCNSCIDCISLRVPVQTFKPNKSQRKALKNNQDVRIELCKPEYTDTHLNLYNKYHNHQKEVKNWAFTEHSSNEYIQSYIDGAQDFGHEVKYFLGDTLVAVGFIDILKNAISSIYFYYDPAYKNRSLGTFSVLMEMELCKQFEVEYLFLGYWVQDCPSMQYKASFKPHQTLVERPTLADKPNWVNRS